MHILVTSQPSSNHYLQEVYATFAAAGVNVTYHDGLPESGIESYDLVHIHWPEALANWRPPKRNDIHTIKQRLARANVLLCTRHNYEPHTLKGTNARELYSTVFSMADAIIHMGWKSQSEYVDAYPQFARRQTHAIIPHPLYSRHSRSTVSRSEARAALGLPMDAVIVLVFGSIRHSEERRFTYQVFKDLRLQGKHLLVASQLKPCYVHRALPGKWKLLYLEQRLRFIALDQTIHFGHVPETAIPSYFSAANSVFLPRRDVLNSGIPYLAWSYGRPVVGPRCGNLEEHLNLMGQTSYVSGDIRSASNALHETLLKSDCDWGPNIRDRAKKLYASDAVSDSTLKFIASLIRRKPRGPHDTFAGSAGDFGSETAYSDQ